MPIYSFCVSGSLRSILVRGKGRSILVLFLLSMLVLPGFGVTTTGTNTGAIPDGTAPNPTCGAPRDINFAVSGQTAPIGSVIVDFTATHTWIGDLQLFLIAPDATEHLLFSYVGRTPPVDGGFGDNSNLGAAYRFSDVGTQNIWTAATGGADAFVIPAGNYRSQAAGPFTPVDPGPAFTSMNSAFAGVADPNGNWTLRFLDCAAGDIGTVSAATLTLLIPSAAGVNISGRAVTTKGQPISNARISLFGGQFPAPITVTTNPFGYYLFENIPSGQTYVISAGSRKVFFTNPSQVVTVFDELTGLDFIAEDQ